MGSIFFWGSSGFSLVAFDGQGDQIWEPLGKLEFMTLKVKPTFKIIVHNFG